MTIRRPIKSHPVMKKIVAAVAITLLLTIGVYLFLQYPLQNLGTTKCTFSNWESFEMPELTTTWQLGMENAGLEVISLTGYGVGEGENCITYTLFGPIYTSSPATSAANTSFDANIRVKDISDDELGKVVRKILDALEQAGPGFYPAIAQITFTAPNESKRIQLFGVVDTHQLYVYQSHRPDLTDAEFFQAMDGRFTPPTVTPPPTDD